ncbi:MAG TPA: hypothetical protein VEQ63_03770 [Bryobacteraceae bacterium]|nr:hypothetical protein [Bryobacteraceae bacterium]
MLFLLGGGLTLQATTHCVTIAGLGGEPDYEQRFGNWVKDVEKTLAASTDVKHLTLSGAGASKAKIRETLERLSRESKAQDQLIVFLIGHGSYDGLDYKMNISGPDVTAVELAGMLDRVPSARQLVVNATSASGASVHALQRENRTIITATKSGTEKNATIFPRDWIEALRDAAADTDKNEVITALEAFRFAELKTKQFYETNKRLATEHPTLDGGDKNASLTAGRFALLTIGTAQAASNDPEKRKLLDQRTEIEEQIDRLKFQKAAMPAQEYKQHLQALLLALAKVQAEIDK